MFMFVCLCLCVYLFMHLLTLHPEIIRTITFSSKEISTVFQTNFCFFNYNFVPFIKAVIMGLDFRIPVQPPFLHKIKFNTT